jgi:hypothetical protein
LGGAALSKIHVGDIHANSISGKGIVRQLTARSKLVTGCCQAKSPGPLFSARHNVFVLMPSFLAARVLLLPQR